MSSLHNEQLLATSPNVVLIDTIGMFYPCDVNHSQHLMLYAFGSIIIVYNLQSNMKTFIKYHNTAVSSLNFIKHNNNNNELMFVSIDKSSQPMICLWNTKLQCVYNENIKTRPNFHTYSSHVSQLDESTFLILITSIDCNLLYSFDITTYIISFIYNININTNSYINAFRCFHTSSTPSCVFQTSNSLSFYSISNNDHNNNPLRLNANVSFQFNLRNHSLQLNTFYNVICVITEKGNALLYDSVGNSISVFTPLHNNEKYIAACFSNENIILSTNTTKIYCFSIKENKLNFYTDLFMYIKQHKINFQLRTAENCNGKVYRAENDFANVINDIEYISFNEHCDSLYMMCVDGSIMYVPLSNVVRNTRQLYNFTAVGNNVSLYTFNAKCGGELVAFPIESDYYGNNTSSPYVFISNSKDNKTYMNVYKVNYPNEKVVNYFIDVQGDSNSNSDNTTNNYFTSITFHPHFNKHKYLYAGDTLGYLYIFDISDNNNIYLYTKHKVASLPITHISLNTTASLICIGLETGMNIICDITKNCEFCIRPNDHFLNPVELPQLKLKHQTTSYSYFFIKHPSYIIYRKSHNELELSSLTTSSLNVTQLNISKLLSIQTNILDINMHISENYIICLTEIKQIIIMQISNGEVTAVIDLNSQCSDVLNISLDESGLYLLLICDIVHQGRMLLVIEIGTGNIKESISCGINVVRCRFDSVGCRIGCVGENGELALWGVSYEMRKAIENVKEEMKVNKEFWEQYDIKYYIEGEQVGRYSDEYVQADVFGEGNNNGDGRYYPIQERRRVIEKDDIGIDVGVDNDVMVGNSRENYNRSMLRSGGNRKGHNYYSDGNSLQECYLRRRRHGREVEGNVGNNMEMRFLRKSPAQEEVDKYNLNERVSKVNETNVQKNITKPVVKTFSKQQQSITIPKQATTFRSSSNIICNQDPNIYATQNYNYNNKQKPKQHQHNTTSSFLQHSQPQQSFPNLKQKIIADSSSQQQSNIRIQNIANAINQMVLNSSTPLPQHHHHPNNSFEPNQTIPLNNQPYSPPIQPNNNNNSTHQVNLKTENSQKYYINNKQPHLSNQHSSTTSIHEEPPVMKHSKKYPEPIDIDEDLQDNNTNVNVSHHSKKNIVNVSHSSVGDSFSIVVNTNNVNTQQKPSNTSLTDQIDYLYDNIYNFEKVHNIK